MYLENLNPTAETDYSLWKASRRVKRPFAQIQPIRNEDRTWARRSDETAATFARHLKRTFKPNDMQSDANLSVSTQNTQYEKLKLLTPKEVAYEIKHLDPKKTPGWDKITGKLLKELLKRGLVQLTNISNAILRLQYFPVSWKEATMLMKLNLVNHQMNQNHTGRSHYCRR